MLEILLIRHGETDYNTSKRFTGITDAELNEKGREQALKLGAALKDEAVEHIYSSDLRRCVETGECIFRSGARTFTEDLREMNFGRWEGLTYEEIKNRYPDELGKWEKDWLGFIIDEGESFDIMSKRVISKFEEIVEKHKSAGNAKIAIVSHSGCIRTILGHFITGSVKDGWKFCVENATVSRLRLLKDNNDKDYYYLMSLNEA